MAQGSWGESGDRTVFRVTVRWLAAGQKCQTGFYLRDTGLLNDQDAEDVVNLVDPWVQQRFIHCLHQDDRIDTLDAENITTKVGFAKSYSGLAGAGGGVRAPNFLQVPVALKGELRRRYGSGRMLWPVAAVGWLNGQQLTDANLADFNTTAADLATRFIGSDLTLPVRLVHAHDTLPAKGARPLVPRQWYDVTSIRVSSLVSSIRRRKAGVGS